MESIGYQIKKVRSEKGMTQEDLAGNTISRSLLSLIENGYTKPSLHTLEYIASKLDKPVSYFLGGAQSVQEELDELIITLEQKLNNGNLNSSIERAFRFFEHIKDQTELFTQNSLGKLYTYMGISTVEKDSVKAQEYFKLAAECLETHEHAYLCKCYNNLGILMWKSKNYVESRDFFILANQLHDNIHLENLYTKLDILYNLALVQYSLYNYTEVNRLANEAIGYFEKYELYYNYGYFCMLQTLADKYLGNIDLALKHNKKAIDYYVLTENDYMKYRCYVNQCALLRICKDYSKALLYIEEAIEYFKAVMNEDKLVNAQTEQLKVFFFANKESDQILSLAETLLKKIKNPVECRGEILAIIGGLLIKDKQYEKSFYYLTEAKTLLAEHPHNEMHLYISLGFNKIYEQNKEYISSYDSIHRAAPYNDPVPDFYLQN